MKALILLIMTLNACTNRENDTCLQIEPIIKKDIKMESFEEFRVYFFSFSNPTFLNEIKTHLDSNPLDGSITSFGDPDYKSKWYTIRKDSSTINKELKILLSDKCYKLKLNPSIRNYLVHLESKDSITCFGNNDKFIAIE